MSDIAGAELIVKAEMAATLKGIERQLTIANALKYAEFKRLGYLHEDIVRAMGKVGEIRDA